MKGIWRLRHLWENTRFRVGAYRLLRNARELLEGRQREKRGERITEQPVLHFRNGLKISTVAGGYGGFVGLFPEFFLDKCYQPTPDYIPRDGWTVVDIGANMGFFTIQAATAAENIRIVAVEPVPHYVEVWRTNIEANRIKNAEIVHAAVAGQSGKSMSFQIWRSSPGGEPKTHQAHPEGAIFETFSVPTVTLGELLETARVDCCDLLKLDVEGAEYEIFDSTPAEVWKKIRRVIMETHGVPGRSETDLARILEHHHFTVTQRNYKGTHLIWASKQP